MADYPRVVIGVVAIVLGALYSLFRTRPKPSNQVEPPCVLALIPVPYLGHLIGLFWQRSGYYTNVSNKWKMPIVSLSILGGKIHIVSSPELMHSLHRQPRAISFWFMEAQFTPRLGGMSQASTDALQANLGAHDEGSSLLMEGLKVTQQAMSPQGGLRIMTRSAASVTTARLQALRLAGGADRVDLWEWVRHEITVVTTESIYGEANPYRDPKVEAGFWDFADDTVMLLMSKHLPRVFAPKGFAGREAVVEAMSHYFRTGGHEDSSPLTSARYHALKRHINDEDLARFECVNGIALLANSVPAAFWTIYHIFSDERVLQQVRAQLKRITSSEELEEGKRRLRKINLEALKDAPILFSIIQEALRYRATGTGPRMVMDDTTVGPDHLWLKKGSTVIIANSALHMDKAAWGVDADRFVADRFCGRVPTHAFRAFGGGVNLCPGKNFAMVTIAALVAMLVMNYDLAPAAGASWDEPGQDLTNMSLQVAPPRRKVLVDIVPPVETEMEIWEFQI